MSMERKRPADRGGQLLFDLAHLHALEFRDAKRDGNIKRATDNFLIAEYILRRLEHQQKDKLRRAEGLR